MCSTISNNLSSANVSYSSQLMNSPIGQYNNKNIHQDFDHKYKLELPQNSVPSSEFNNSAFSNPKSNISELNIGENKSDEQLSQSNKILNETSKIHCHCSTCLLYCKHLTKNNIDFYQTISNLLPYNLSPISLKNQYSIDTNNDQKNILKKSLSKINKQKNFSLNLIDKILTIKKIKKINNNNNSLTTTNTTNNTTHKSYLNNKHIKRSYTQLELFEAIKAIYFGQLGTRKAANIYGELSKELHV
uniref:Uncharacterized protein n=1 Tax=Schistosoma mansoni TaxID=6183 RepID=A0A5K4FBM9_SCHMA